MKGVHPDTGPVFHAIRQLPLLEEYMLVGGTAISLQIGHRSEKDIDHVRLADLYSLGVMKLDVMFRRNVFRDYYDVYAILKKGVGLKEIVEGAGRYSKHRVGTKMILSILSDGTRFRREEGFGLLQPLYDIDSDEIEAFLRERITGEFALS